MRRVEKKEWIQNSGGRQRIVSEFYEAYADNAIRTASAITRNREMAKDAVQETFIRVYRQINSYNPELPFDPWFYRILTNECLRLLKKESPLSKFEHPDLENDPSLAEESFDHLSDLYDTIQSLDDSASDPTYFKICQRLHRKRNCRHSRPKSQYS